jgi:hypothetical protein
MQLMMEDFKPSGCTRSSPSMQQYHLGTSSIDFIFTTNGHKTSRSDGFLMMKHVQLLKGVMVRVWHCG